MTSLIRKVFPITLGAFTALVILAVTAGAVQAQNIEIEVWAPADKNERYRFDAISLAANVLNEELKIEGSDTRVIVKKGTSFSGSQGWAQLKQGFSLAVEAGKGPHIIVGGHEDIPVWGSAGLIHPIEDYTDLEAWPFSDLFPSLWPIMSWNGQVWGAPQDAESRPFFAWNPHLKAIGYSDADIAAMPARIKNGQYTLNNVLEDAKKIQDKGLVKKGYGFYPRATKGGDYWQFYAVQKGGDMYDSKSGKLILDKGALLGYYQFFNDAVNKYGVTKKNHIGMEWDQWYNEVANGKAGLWHGGTWHYARYTRREGLTDFFDKVMFSLIPAGGSGGKATTLTHPLTYLISKRAQGEEIEMAARLITIASEPRLNTLHAIASAHLGITKAQTKVSQYADDRWTAEATALLQSAFALPNSTDFGQYDTLVWKGLTAAWSGGVSPQEAVNTVVKEMQATMGDKVIIR
jgi:inositol-phosphate transport system substrate-binding protein|tara:strand:+ start:276 stop:1658 length:1383 start_codon:yes stop_codon:yes gene_type:complete